MHNNRKCDRLLLYAKLFSLCDTREIIYLNDIEQINIHQTLPQIKIERCSELNAVVIKLINIQR